jgi:hypothetical protein
MSSSSSYPTLLNIIPSSQDQVGKKEREELGKRNRERKGEGKKEEGKVREQQDTY